MLFTLSGAVNLFAAIVIDALFNEFILSSAAAQISLLLKIFQLEVCCAQCTAVVAQGLRYR